MPKEPTVITGADGVEYVIYGGRLIEKCQHRTTTDKSVGKTRWIVCADCEKTIVYNEDISRPSVIDVFRSAHGRNPRGEEYSQFV